MYGWPVHAVYQTCEEIFFIHAAAETVDEASMIKRILMDETGGEVLEYSLIIGLIILASMAAMTNVGTKVVAKWGSLNSSM